MNNSGLPPIQELNYKLSFDTGDTGKTEYRLWKLFATRYATKKDWYCEILASWPDRFVEACMKHRFDIDALRATLELHGVRCDTVGKRRVYRFLPFKLGKTRPLEVAALKEYSDEVRIGRRTNNEGL